MAYETKINNTTINLVKGDITDLETEAFVFYAQDNLELNSGFGNAISTRGGPSVKEELQQIGSVASNEAVVSAAGNLKAEYIIHANGPKFQEVNTEEKLKTTMINTLKTAADKGLKKIAFPGMGTGFYGIPKPVAAKIMRDSLNEFFGSNSSIEEVTLCLLENRELSVFEAEFKS